jgi:ubiquitin-protein ligase
MNEDKSLSAFPEGDNIMKWKGTIKAPEETVFAGMEYKMSIEFPSSYPFSAPTVKFETPCFHPNVSENGDICLDILKVSFQLLCRHVSRAHMREKHVRVRRCHTALVCWANVEATAKRLCLVLLGCLLLNSEFVLVPDGISPAQDQWSALYDARTILLSIQSLLGGMFLSVLVGKESPVCIDPEWALQQWPSN